MMQFPNAQILVFAKAPQPGRVKTRLRPVLGNDGAAELYTQLLSRQMAWLHHAKLASVTCWCAPDVEHTIFGHFQTNYGMPLAVQKGVDLGARMYHAAVSELQSAEMVILVGADCPAMTDDYLSDAILRLASGCDAVLGPAEDGGYVLLGLRQADLSLFSGVDWGSSRVLSTTIERLVALNWTFELMPELWDLDRPEDIERYHRWLEIRGETAALPPHAPVN